ncbi:hypothetical protein DFR50_14054 [Roseiarcus fermentans]|uniref:Uncharacterized protein n=1 Tax=Roseiarcus fermentans TaxID=1473586 RepID=A0A366EP63_9HYPH|nr:DUF1178 family protein [Roseiarcus fermentans]RBP04181.1 hypothetical protein DFR50_14054 [Roseiarcus fermentans]
MIRYALGCAGGHEFDSWFPDSAAYETQRLRGLVACPECGSTAVDKAIMAPAVVGGDRAAPETSAVALLDDRRRSLRAMAAHLRREIEANTDDVGAKFPEVARAIHAGDEPERAIRGRATPEEARALIEEGVGVMPIPALADEMN